MKVLLINVLILFVLNVYSQIQNPSIQWQKCFGGSNADFAENIEITSDGGYIIAGYTSSTNGNVTSNHGGTDAWIIKTDASGNIQWQKTFGGTNDDVATAIKQTSDGGYVFIGNTSSNNGDVSGYHDNGDIWVVKLSANGNLEWQKCIGGYNDDVAYSMDITTNGDIVIAGATNSDDGDITYNNGGYDFCVVKISANGVIQYVKTYGGYKQDVATSIACTSDGGCIVAGYSSSNDGDVSGHHGTTSYSDYWVVKLISSGNIEWQKSYGGTNDDEAYAVIQTSDGNYMVAGYTKSNNGDVTSNNSLTGYTDFWILKLSSTGNIIWQKNYGGSYYEKAYSIKPTTDGGFVIGGLSGSNDGDVSGNHSSEMYSDYWLLKIDSMGNKKFQACYGGSSTEYSSSVAVAGNNGYILAGSSNSNNGDVSGNHGNYDYWIVKLMPEVGIEENAFNHTIKLYPIPTRDILTIESQEPIPGTISIFDILGNKLADFTGQSKQIQTINLQSLPEGMYFVLINYQLFKINIIR